ncbi:MAG TPA: bifunctional phosphopantothenoylcysteine decarboxylase/phosphopantothenate--cysteine ligase CoaBC, partial [Candidatus Eisenbacteria bacterium]
MLRGRTVVVGVSGGIAAYKACELVRWLTGRQAAVIVVMTPAATEFVAPLTFQVLSGNPVVLNLWGDQQPEFQLPQDARRRIGGRVEHVDVAEAADALVIAPATADLIARLVHGVAPDALTSVALASRAPLVVCPAMDREMWAHPATQENLRALRARGATIVGPERGSLASGLEGPGRLAPIEAIGEAVERVVSRGASLRGVKVLVSAGRTEEPLDPVRVLTNRSSGRMGVALAEAARDRGAEVALVAGAMSVEPPPGVRVVTAATAAEMERAVVDEARKADLVLMAAAVSDYRPARVAREKIKRGEGRMTLELEPNPDILARAAARRRPGQVFVGFALETSQGLRRARAKLAQKGLDLIVLNAPGESIGRGTNRVSLVDPHATRRLPELPKREVAERVLDRAVELRAGRRRG